MPGTRTSLGDWLGLASARLRPAVQRPASRQRFNGAFALWLNRYQESAGAVTEDERGHRSPFAYQFGGGSRLVFRVQGQSQAEVAARLKVLTPREARETVCEVVDATTSTGAGHWCGTATVELPMWWAGPP